jgi:hypothetical protein
MKMNKMTNKELVDYLDKLDKKTFNSYVDADTKVRYFVDKYGRHTKKALEPYANPTKTPNPNRKPLAPYKSNPIPKSNIGR